MVIILFMLIICYIFARRRYNELKKFSFHDYFIKNTTIVSICSVMAGADIKILQILSSKIAGLSIFSAKFSEDAENYIFWCALVGFLIEDIPQFGIQVTNLYLWFLMFIN